MTDPTPTEDPLSRAIDVLVRFFRHLDDGDYESLAGLLDGEWHRQGRVLTTREGVMEALAARSQTRRIHHLLTNVCGQEVADGTIALTAYMLVVQHDSGTYLDGPAPLEGITSIRTLRARAVATEDGWRIRWLKSDPPSFAAGL
ncbi:nuclear transport factor 2 family protein [Pseudooceanicola nanhaiensis]|uniref:nuclear transport factor 2 family protein n=2 Tax=Pseudooceanicola nanhaiensis TaxID=375761 RepID=UPI003510E273